MAIAAPPSTPTGTYANEPISGDSLTQAIRSLSNYLAGAGQGAVNSGQQQIGAATSTVSPAIDFWQKILSGDKGAMAQALAPITSQISQGNQQALQQGTALAPRGGGTASALTQLPFQTAGQIGNAAAQLQPAAATNLTGISQFLGQLGLGETGAGSNLLNTGANVDLTRRGQNVQQSGQATGILGSLLGPVSNEVGSLLGVGLSKIPGLGSLTGAGKSGG